LIEEQNRATVIDKIHEIYPEEKTRSKGYYVHMLVLKVSRWSKILKTQKNLKHNILKWQLYSAMKPSEREDWRYSTGSINPIGLEEEIMFSFLPEGKE